MYIETYRTHPTKSSGQVTIQDHGRYCWVIVKIRFYDARLQNLIVECCAKLILRLKYVLKLPKLRYVTSGSNCTVNVLWMILIMLKINFRPMGLYLAWRSVLEYSKFSKCNGILCVTKTASCNTGRKLYTTKWSCSTITGWGLYPGYI